MYMNSIEMVCVHECRPGIHTYCCFLVLILCIELVARIFEQLYTYVMELNAHNT